MVWHGRTGLIAAAALTLSISPGRAFTEADYVRLNAYCEAGSHLPNGEVDQTVWRDCMETRELHDLADAQERLRKPQPRFNAATGEFNRSPIGAKDIACDEVVNRQFIKDTSVPFTDGPGRIALGNRLWNECMRQAGVLRKP